MKYGVVSQEFVSFSYFTSFLCTISLNSAPKDPRSKRQPSATKEHALAGKEIAYRGSGR